MNNVKRFDVIVNNGDMYENAIDIPENQMIRKDYDDLLTETLADSEEKKESVIYYKAVASSGTRADDIQKIMFQEGSIIDYLAEHPYPERILVVCPDEEQATMYQMNYNFYYATEKSDRLGLEKWD